MTDTDAPREPSPLERAQRALGAMGARHELILRLFRLSPDWLPEEPLLERALTVLNDVCAAEASSVLMLDRAAKDLYFAAATGPVSADIKRFRLRRDEGIAGWCVSSAQVLRINNVKAQERWHSEISESVGFNVQSILAAPIRLRNRVIGCVELINKLTAPDGEFQPEDEELITDAAECLGLLFALRGRREDA